MFNKIFNSPKKYKYLIFLGLILFIVRIIAYFSTSTEIISTLALFLMFSGIFLTLGYPLSKVLEENVPVNDPNHTNDERNKTITQMASYKTIQMTVPLMLIILFNFIQNVELVIALLSILVYILLNLFMWKRFYMKKI